MGYDLIGHGGFSANSAGWPYLLKLAGQFGWAPEGTVYVGDLDGDWSDWPYSDEESAAMGERRGYYENNGNLVTDTDAAAIAVALRLALEALGETLDAEDRSWVESFAAYCEKGKFLIT